MSDAATPNKPLDPELMQLRDDVERVFGMDTLFATRRRAADRAAVMLDRNDSDHDEWYALVDDCWKDELRRLLRPQ